jgi:aspartyl-tRNA(Asn)/glutamyl-tRNA(Gln) amidotransferase subunit C
MSSPKISLEEVLKVARLARLAPSTDEASALAHDLDAILGYVALLDEVDTSHVEPTSHAVALSSALREDQLVPGLNRDDALAAAPASREGGFSVPKVLEVES